MYAQNDKDLLFEVRTKKPYLGLAGQTQLVEATAINQSPKKIEISKIISSQKLLVDECPSPKRLTRRSLRNHSFLESDPFFGNSCSQHSHGKFDAEQPEQLNNKIKK